MKIKTISEKMLFTTVKINTMTSKNEQSTGTGFVFGFALDDNKNDLYLVTNKHVIKDAITWSFRFIPKKTDGEPDYNNPIILNLNNLESLWFGHEDENVDVTIIPFGLLYNLTLKEVKKEIFVQPIYAHSIPTNIQIENEINALESINFVGYPSGLIDEYNNTPIFRKGTTATPYALDFNGEKKFLIDATVVGGSSGSPVFILEEGSYTPKGQTSLVFGNKVFFLGIVAKSYEKTNCLDLKVVPIQTNDIQNKVMSQNIQMLDLGVVFKAETILETIEQYKIKNKI
mgnify:CR=1